MAIKLVQCLAAYRQQSIEAVVVARVTMTEALQVTSAGAPSEPSLAKATTRTKKIPQTRSELRAKAAYRAVEKCAKF